MIEPFQPGKIPVVFVHGLLSDRYTWASMANEIHARPDLVDRYQLLGFEYSTGEPFLASAATLRRQLMEWRKYYDPQSSDPAMADIVLIGHSMGGLVSKLQVTSSEDLLWRSVAKCAFDTIQAEPKTRIQLAEAFFFEPVPTVTRVLYVGTPHRGSPWAKRPIGRLGSRLVKEPEEQQSLHHQLLTTNPNVFSREFSRRIPTSVDLLREDSPLLTAMDRLATAAGVQQHSVIGSWGPMLGAIDSDSVVPVSSAIRANVVSQKTIRAKHANLHRDENGIEEIIRILRMHARDHGSPASPFNVVPR